MDCQFKEKCWKHTYNNFFHENGKKWDNSLPPSRSQLIFSGYCQGKPELLKTKRVNGKIQNCGLWCDVLPTEYSDTWCPIFNGKNLSSCEVYEKEIKRFERKVQFKRGSNRKTLSPHLRKAVARRDRYFCYYCNRHNTELKELDIRCVIDHIVPLAVGGSNDMDNLCFSCDECNSSKGEKIWAKGEKMRKFSI